MNLILCESCGASQFIAISDVQVTENKAQSIIRLCCLSCGDCFTPALTWWEPVVKEAEKKED